MNGADRQWQLNRRNFEGCWQGTSHWYLRGQVERGEAPGGEPAMGELALARPSRVIENTRYAISFSAADTGVWDGSGLLFAPGGKRRLELSRVTYNRGGTCWQFHGAGGQSSLSVDAAAPRFGHEINLFHGRSRSMLVLLWDRGGGSEGGGEWRLGAVAAVPFRCALSEPLEPPRPPLAVDGLLAAVEGWPGTLETLQPGCWPEQDPPSAPTAPFRAARFAAAGLCAALADRLVFAAPELLPAGAFRVEAGCLLTPRRFHRISLVFDDKQRLSAVELRRYRPDPPPELSPGGGSATAG